MYDAYPFGRANVRPALDGLIVPVDEADEAEDESSSDQIGRAHV